MSSRSHRSIIKEALKQVDLWTAYACETAAAFTRAFLITRPIDPIAKP